MNQKAKTTLVLLVVAVLPTVAAARVVAQSIQEPERSVPLTAPSEPAQEAEANIMTTQAQAEDTDATPEARLQARLNERKVKYLPQPLPTAERQRLGARCAPAQGKLRSLEGRVQGIETARQQAYVSITTKLTSLSGRLTEQGIDSAPLTDATDKLKQQTDEFSQQMTAYKQAVADLGAMDCAADVEGFKASLLAARESLGALRSTAQTIRTTLNENVQSALKDVRSQLTQQSKAEEQ